MTLIEEYKKSLKMAEAEELFDLAFYRPIAFLFVKIIYRMPITPNQITFFSLLAGLTAAYYFSLGIPGQFTVGAVWFFISNILDCSDGQLARLQKSGTSLGRVIDGIVDYIITIAVFICLGSGLTILTGEPSVWLLAVAAGISSAVHAVLFDYQQQEYISNVRGEKNFLGREIDRFESEMLEFGTSKGSSLRRTVLRLYLYYARIQQRTQQKKEMRKQHPPELYRKANRRVMRWWSFLGTTMNRSILIVAAFFQQPVIFFWIIIIVGNLWLFIAIFWQKKIQRQLDADTEMQNIPSGTQV